MSSSEHACHFGHSHSCSAHPGSAIYKSTNSDYCSYHTTSYSFKISDTSWNTIDFLKILTSFETSNNSNGLLLCYLFRNQNS